ncbi:MAG: UDP-N-acetylglucosamine 4,6-dehydratase family protein, partial [Burkholderiales bacterium]
VRTLPGLADLTAGRVALSDIHELDIDDLLGRDPVKPNGLLLNRHTLGKTVLVTGAGGSIGSELCRQILACRPARLLLFEVSEPALYTIHQELSAALDAARAAEPDRSHAEVIALLGNVTDAARIDAVMRTYTPHLVVHAAAYKHVPIVEHNPAEGLRNNVWGTWVCAQTALRHGVPQFVLVSTDKAVRPTNIMGASKRLAEMVLQALQAEASANRLQLRSGAALQGASAEGQLTQFSMVRFGNVLGSSGSVVPLFRQQIAAGGPITLTHADITRYFMTIPEAAQLVIQAGAMGSGGDVFVLDMGEPVRIEDLAHRMIELSGLTLKSEESPNGDIEVVVTGLRPGEKLYEELLIGDNPEPTQHVRIMKAHEAFLPWGELQLGLQALEQAMQANDLPQVRLLLQRLVSGYTPDPEIVDWLWRESAP